MRYRNNFLFLGILKTETSYSENNIGTLSNNYFRKELKESLYVDYFTISYLKVYHHYNEISNAKEIFFRILDDEISNKMPIDIIDKAKKNFSNHETKKKFYCKRFIF